MLFTLPPWQYHRRTYLGRIDRVDASAARWDEEGFLQCHLRYQEDPLPFYRTPDIHFGWLWGCENKAQTLAYYEYRLGQGIKKDTGIWFLLASIVDHTGRTQAPHPVGEYAGMGTGILASCPTNQFLLHFGSKNYDKDQWNLNVSRPFYRQPLDSWIEFLVPISSYNSHYRDFLLARFFACRNLFF